MVYGIRVGGLGWSVARVADRVAGSRLWSDMSVAYSRLRQ